MSWYCFTLKVIVFLKGTEMHLQFAIDTNVFDGNYMLMLKRADEAQRRIVSEVANISPILSKYLTDFTCKCEDPGFVTACIE